MSITGLTEDDSPEISSGEPPNPKLEQSKDPRTTELLERFKQNPKGAISKEERDTILKNDKEFLSNPNYSKLIELFRNEERFEKLYTETPQAKEALTKDQNTLKSDPKLQAFVNERTGVDISAGVQPGSRAETYLRAAFIAGKSTEELKKLGIDEGVRIAAESLGVPKRFKASELIGTDKKIAGISDASNTDIKKKIESTVPAERLSSTEITRIGDTLSYKDPSNPRAEFRIDMGKEPPRLSQSLGGITIEMITPEETTDGKVKIDRLNTVKSEKKELSTSLESGLNGEKIKINLENISIKDLEKMRDSSVISDALALTEGGKVLNPEDISNLRVRAQENLLELRTIDLLASTNSDRKDIKEIKSVMDYSEYPIPDFSDKQRRIDGGIGSMKKILELKGGLGAYIEKREEELTLQEQIKGLKGPDASEFSRNARKNLEFLNSVGFGNLENKQILTNTMAAMNEINPPGANNEPFIDPSLNTGLSEERQRALLNALVQITRVAYDAQPEGQGTEWEKSKKWMSGWRNTDLSDTILMRRMITSDGWRDAVKNVANGTESSRWNKDAIKSKLGGSISQESELPKVPTGTTMAGEPTMKVG